MSGRPMKFPYTFAAQLAQFPYKYMFKTNWILRYYLYSLVVTSPFFYWVHKKVNSPAALANHKAYLEKQAAKGHH